MDLIFCSNLFFFITIFLLLRIIDLIVQSHQGKRAVAAIYRIKNSKKRISFKTRESMRVEEADLVSKLISGPSNFSHLQHMGPGDGLQILQDIPRVSRCYCFLFSLMSNGTCCIWTLVKSI